jgi:hypothetical protein
LGDGIERSRANLELEDADDCWLLLTLVVVVLVMGERAGDRAIFELSARFIEDEVDEGFESMRVDVGDLE